MRALVLALFLAFSAPTYSMEMPKTLNEVVEMSWDYACKHAPDAHCENYTRPSVYFSPDMPNALRGLYMPGEYWILVNIYLLDYKAVAATMAHEFTHYIQYQEKKFSPTNTCEMEKQAFDVANALADDLQLTAADARGKPWDEAKNGYPSCGDPKQQRIEPGRISWL